MALINQFAGRPAPLASTRWKNTFAQLYAISAILLGIIHLTTGSMLILIFVFTVISLIGAGFLMKGNPRYSDFFIFLLSAYSGYAALLMKAILAQPLQQNLMVPVQSAAYLFIGFCSITSCAIAADLIVGSRQSPIGARIETPVFMRNALIPLFIMGFATRILHVLFNPSIKDGADIGSGFGGFGTFEFILSLACVILLRLYSLRRTSPYGATIIIVMVAIAILSVITNTKKNILDFALLGVVSVYAFDIKVKPRVLTLFGLLMATVILFISPAIHLMRTGFRDMTVMERITGMYTLIEQHGFSPAALSVAEGAFMKNFTYSYNEYGSYIYPDAQNIDRFSLILPIDQVARGLDSMGTMGVSPFFEEIGESVMPSVLIDKDPETGPDLIAWKYSIRANTSIARPVIGFTASSLAAQGLLGVICLPWLLLLPFFVFSNYFFGNIKGRVFGVFVVAIAFQMVEKEIDQVIPFVFRTGPVIILTVLIFLRMFSRQIRIGKFAL
ncbi:hypothetical protein [Pseudogemmobacter humi]|nr:hypothetical protein [Pseudogemmobacter humi]